MTIKRTKYRPTIQQIIGLLHYLLFQLDEDFINY